ncbi:MAG TPA: substrate-binding domain-containing protein [Polyangiaceae bacterium]
MGILANAYGDPYSLRIAHGAAQEISRSGGHAIFFGGGFPRAPLFRSAADACVLPGSLDGWVLVGEMLRDGWSELAPAARAARGTVTLGFELPGLPSVTVDDQTGIFQAVGHLVKRHERRRIAFITGPEGSVDGQHRFTAYRMALESLGLALDPALVAAGNYETRSGGAAIRQLKRQSARFDALVCANDLMAIGASEALRAAGKRVPEEISIVGFDDLEDASFASPSLTTIRQPLMELGAAAARLTWTRTAGEDAERTVVPTPLVIRESCGCLSSDYPERRSHPPGVDPQRTKQLREEGLRELVRRGLSSSRLHRELERVADSIVRAPDFPGLTGIMSEVIELLGLRRFLLCTYAGGQRHARVALESSGRDVAFHHQSQPFPVEQVLPAGYLNGDKPVQLVIEPLEYADEHFGYVVLEGDLRNGLAHLALRRHLGSAVARMSHGRELRRLYAAEKRRTEADR